MQVVKDVLELATMQDMSPADQKAIRDHVRFLVRTIICGRNKN